MRRVYVFCNAPSGSSNDARVGRTTPRSRRETTSMTTTRTTTITSMTMTLRFRDDERRSCSGTDGSAGVGTFQTADASSLDRRGRRPRPLRVRRNQPPAHPVNHRYSRRRNHRSTPVRRPHRRHPRKCPHPSTREALARLRPRVQTPTDRRLVNAGERVKSAPTPRRARLSKSVRGPRRV